MNATAVNQVPDADASRKFLPCMNPVIQINLVKACRRCGRRGCR